MLKMTLLSNTVLGFFIFQGLHIASLWICYFLVGVSFHMKKKKIKKDIYKFRKISLLFPLNIL